MNRQVFRVALLCFLLMAALSVGASAAIVDSGTCGANVTWTLDDAGTLTISGTGSMADYNWNTMPWYSQRSSIRAVQIEHGVTFIGKNAFYGHDSLTDITIPDSVTSIGENAFTSCENLTSVIIPNSVTSIGTDAFSYCENLTSVTISNSVTSISQLMFFNCNSLTSVTIPSSVASIGSQAFAQCNSLTSVTIPDSVTSIGDMAFEYCVSLASVTIPDSVTSIGQNAFQDCTDLRSVTIPDSVTSISFKAFQYCVNLASVTIPDSVTSIDQSAFYRCDGLANVYYGSTETQWNAITIEYGNEPLTNATIHYAQSPVTPVTRGDVNGDGVIDDEDVNLVSKSLVGLVTLTSEQERAADMDGNGTVNITDLAELRRYVEDLTDPPEETPVGPPAPTNPPTPANPNNTTDRTLPNTGVADYKAAYLCAFAFSAVCAAWSYRRIRKKSAVRR